MDHWTEDTGSGESEPLTQCDFGVKKPMNMEPSDGSETATQASAEPEAQRAAEPAATEVDATEVDATEVGATEADTAVRRPWAERLASFSRFAWLMPWLSLAWGVASGILVARRFDSAGKVLSFALALLLASAALGVWMTWVERLAGRGETENGARDFGSLALRHRGRIDWAAVTVTQIFSQYIFMFSLSFLWATHAWLHLGACILLGASTLWDPLYFRIVRFDVYRLLVRGMGMALSASFLVGVLSPRNVVHCPTVVLCAAAVGVFPWRFLRSGFSGLSRITARSFFVRWIPMGLLALAALAHSALGGVWRFPVLSVWAKRPHFAWQEPNDQWVALPEEGFLEEVKEAARGIKMSGLLKSAPAGGRLCCVTPLVAPRALQSDVVHEWWVGGSRIDVIELPAFQGRDESSAYRTYSCKKNLPEAVRTEGLECRVFIGTSTGKRIQVGRVFASGR